MNYRQAVLEIKIKAYGKVCASLGAVGDSDITINSELISRRNHKQRLWDEIVQELERLTTDAKS